MTEGPFDEELGARASAEGQAALGDVARREEDGFQTTLAQARANAAVMAATARRIDAWADIIQAATLALFVLLTTAYLAGIAWVIITIVDRVNA